MFAIPTDVSFQIREDWKYVAMVVDRAQLWLFFLVTTIGTVGILMDAPHIFEFVDQDRIIDIYRGKWKRDNRCQSSRRVNLEKFLTVTMDFLGLQYDPRHSDRVFGNLWAADFWKKTLGFGRFSRSQLDAVGAVLPATPCGGMKGRIV